MNYNKLSPQESAIIENKQTEPPFSGEYDNFYKPGTFICRKCNNPLYSATAKFDAHCGWPAFDECFPNSIKEGAMNSYFGTEITCANCGGHLGHVFRGESFTPTNTRHCANSLALKFIPEGNELPKVLHEKD